MDHRLPESSVEKETSAEFTPPRHWVGMEELSESYWADPKNKEKRGQEFFEKPIEYLESLEKKSDFTVARRDFLTIMGASMAMASAACVRRPVHKIIPYVVKPEEITPGVANYYASTFSEGGQSYGILVRTREGRPIKLEGNPDHPTSRGRLSAQGQASILDLYDPDRLKNPVQHSRDGGGRKDIAWADADAAIAGKLKAAAAGAGRVRLLSGAVTGESTRRLVREFLAAFRAGEHIEFEPLALEDVAEGQAQAYGSAVLPQYRFDRADLVVSLGADFLGTWPQMVEFAGEWIKTRKLDDQKAAQARQSRLICFEGHFTQTGANADERYPVRPGDELKIALALAHELIVNRKMSRYAADAAVTGVLAGYQPEAVAQEIGLEGGAATLKKAADALAASRGRSIVIGGGLHTRTKDGVALQVAISLLNSALDNEGATIDGANGTPVRSNFAAVAKLIQDMKAGAVDVLVLYRSNPLYHLPRGVFGLEEAFRKVPLVIAIADREDESALLADFTLPDHHFLENWGDASPRRGVYSLQQPVISPLHDSRSFEDTMIVWIKSAGLAGGSLASRSADWHSYLMANWRETVLTGGNFDSQWENALRMGVVNKGGAAGGSARGFRSGAMAIVPKYTATAKDGFVLALYTSPTILDGRYANNAWLQELPYPLTSVTWDNYLSLSPASAKKLNVKTNEVVEVTAGDVRVELPVYVHPGLHDQTATVAIGYGRRAVGKVGNGAGVDVTPMIRLMGNRLAYSGHAVQVRRTGKFYTLAQTQWHTLSENRPIINDITLAQFKKSPASANHTDPHLRMDQVPTMWPEHQYKGYRWGMAIDLTSCIGCNACMIACQAENNIPVVGRDQVRVGRQMHWIKIDRYFAGGAENPDVVFQPMLCQHCENAPCETVCPVLATVHDDEGLNVQVYNRCVGTRYCQNNCPYKVRRFNFFDHWKSYEGTLNMVWNPDVTVRTRGIMEKCTFCVQRIRDVKDTAKDEGRKVKDNELKVACQQTCPTDAIVFGDINDPKTRVSKLRNTPQAFRVLEVLNTKPVISYLSKVRNKEASGSEHGHGGGEHHG